MDITSSARKEMNDPLLGNVMHSSCIYSCVILLYTQIVLMNVGIHVQHKTH